MVSTRRSNNESPDLCKVEQKLAKCKTTQRKKVGTKKSLHLSTTRRAASQTHNKNKRRIRQQLTPPTTGHDNEAEGGNMGGEEITPLDISSDEEETKPQIDHSSMLISVSKPPPSHVETSPKNLELLMAAALVLKDELASHLVKTAHKLDTAGMVRSANKCFIGLKSLKVDYGAFHGEVRNLIKCFEELKQVDEQSTCPELGLKVAYEKSVSDVNDAREKLADAERKLMNAQTDYKSTMQRIEKLVAMTHRLKEEADKERKGIENLATQRDHHDGVLSLAEKNKDRYENIQRALDRLQDLV